LLGSAPIGVVCLSVGVLLLLSRVAPVVGLLLLVAGMPAPASGWGWGPSGRYPQLTRGIYRRAVIAGPTARRGRRR
jgi:hypothetical protein